MFAVCRSRFTAVLIWAYLCGVVRAGDADPAARSLMDRIAAVYESLIDYDVTVDVDVSDRLGEDPKTRYRFTLCASRPRCWFVHERVFSPIRYEAIISTDGTSVWGYVPRRKRYVQADAADRPPEVLALKEHHFRYMTRFELLNRVDVSASLAGEKTIRTAGGKVKCILLELNSREWDELLWVDAERCFVVKSVFEQKKGFNRVKTRSVWHLQRLGKNPAPALFRFVPPRDAIRTNVIDLP